MQHTTALEPILTVRRGILHLVKNQNLVQEPIIDLYLQSSRIFRLSGNLQLSWNYLMEAKSLKENQIETLLEEARLFFAKVIHFG